MCRSDNSCFYFVVVVSFLRSAFLKNFKKLSFCPYRICFFRQEILSLVCVCVCVCVSKGGGGERDEYLCQIFVNFYDGRLFL